MLVEILLTALVLTVALLVAGDVTRTQSESLLGHADGPGHDARPNIIGAPRGGRAEAFPGEPAGTGIPAVGAADPARRPENVSGHQLSRTGPAAAHQKSRAALKNWRVRSRLLLLVIIPTVATTAVAFCVARIADSLQHAQIHSPSSSVRDRAILWALVAGIVIVIVLALALWSTLFVAGSVLRPLRRLRVKALEVAGVGLPNAGRRINDSNGDGPPSEAEPIDVDSPDEIGVIARAFDQMRNETLRLAASEAALRGNLNGMFVNLSHRSQSLMDRQIRLIENLEQGEQDAERLAHLVKTYHIAIRMHRNSQNLLVLAGQPLSGRWNQPVALVNVIRAAVSEIEEYERVSLNAQPDIAVSAPAVNDVVHLLAELAENAASFSAADIPVDISGRLLATGGVLIDITDRGVGMGAKEMAYANWRLENPPLADINVSKWMGLFVVGKLAARHGIRVRLHPAEFGGLRALVWLPDDVITQQGPAASPTLSGFVSARSRPGSHETAMHSDHVTAEQRAATRAIDYPPPREDLRDAPLGRWRRMAGGDQRLGPTWSASGPQAVSQAEPPAAVRPSDAGRPDAMGEYAGVSGQEAPALGESASLGSGSASLGSGSVASLSQETSSADDGVIVPPAEGLEDTRRLPIYDAVESSWFRGGHKAPGITPATGGRWSSPADEGWRAAQKVDSPSSGGQTTAGLPRRLPNANLVPGAIPSTQPVVPSRSPAAARDRLSGLQRGVSQGRVAASEAANSGGEDESLAGVA